MQQRTYHGDLTPDAVADALVQHFSTGASRPDVRVQKVGQGASVLVQIGVGADPNDPRYVPVTFAITTIPDGTAGVVVTDGQRGWITPDEVQNAALWVLMGVLFTPFALFGLLWPLAEAYEESLVPREAWNVIETYAAGHGAALADTTTLTHPHAGSR